MKADKVRRRGHSTTFLRGDATTERYHNAVSAMRSLLEESGMDRAERAFASAVAMKRSEEFAIEHGLTVSQGNPVIRRLISGRCKHLLPLTIFKGQRIHCNPPFNDHGTLWLKDGKPHMYTSEIYGLSGEQARAILAYADDHGLDVDFRVDGMYFPGRATLVVYSKKSEK